MKKQYHHEVLSAVRNVERITDSVEREEAREALVQRYGAALVDAAYSASRAPLHERPERYARLLEDKGEETSSRADVQNDDIGFDAQEVAPIVALETLEPQESVPPAKVRYRYAIKALTAYGTTESDEHGSTAYILPRPEQKWGDVMTHPDPAVPDGQDCGAGRYHLHKKLTKEYAPKAVWFWLARFRDEDVIGESDEKVSVEALQLRRITDRQLHKLIRRGWARSADLRSADLEAADLRSADLESAGLESANLRLADLESANLRSADLETADLRSADLESADLESANLRLADLRSADLESANLRSADLRSANLRSANLRLADLRSADLESANLRSANLRSADLRSADNLSDAVLENARYNDNTHFPDDFDPAAAGMIKVKW